MTLAIMLFAAMYVLLMVFSEKRWIIALCAAAVFMFTGILPVSAALPAVNWNVLLMLAGTMMTVELFIESRMPVRMSEQLLKITPNVKWAIVALSLFAGLISAFVDNVATVLMVAPVGLAVAEKLDTNPIPVIISIAVSSNLQGAATLVGDTTSILLGSYANLSFNDFFWFMGRPGICFAVEAGALATVPVLLYLFRKENKVVKSENITEVEDRVPAALLLLTIILLIVASQFPEKPELTNGFICMTLGIIGTLYEGLKARSLIVVRNVIQSVDYKTLLLLTGLFMVIEGITQAGVIDAVAEAFVSFGGSSVLLMYVMIVGVSVLLSAFIDNIPYVATMLPVVTGIAALMGIQPYLFDFGLLIGATLGGNITPVGASANIAGIGILQNNGYKVSTKDFVRIGVPFTLIAATVGALVIWVLYA
ncbi:MAG: TRAP transporter large permease subunit [Solobacterium sp.]|nr:TRAP transporter large permease subunit [Solobacterium sp.]